jgi:hypothetical protein
MIDLLDRIYLCYNNGPTSTNYVCKEFAYFLEADAYFRQQRKDKDNINSTIVGLCYLTPKVFDKYILDRKLKKLFVKTSIQKL